MNLYQRQDTGEVRELSLETWIGLPEGKQANWVPYTPPEPVPYVPQSVTPWQLRRALNAAGLRQLVESAVAASNQDSRDAWDYALEFRRDNALLAAMATGLGVTAEQLDELFLAAASFP